MEVGQNDLIKYLKYRVECSFWNELNLRSTSYLLKKIRPSSSTHAQIKRINLSWSDEINLQEKKSYPFSHSVEIAFKIDADIDFFDESKNKLESMTWNDDLYCYGWLNFTSRIVGHDIADKNKHLLNEFNDITQEAIKDENLESFEGTYQIDNKNAITFFTEITRKSRQNKIEFDDFDSYHDINFCLMDIRYFLGQLLLYKPYIKEITAEPYDNNGKTVYRYFKTFYDTRYFTMCSLLFSLLYNYWDRIGDILALYFLPYMASDKVYFGKVIDKFNCAYTSSPTLGSCPHEPKYIMQMVVCEDTNHWG